MNRYICIHGHFYQPPRENPWLEEVELQDSAHPYHDWNERITAECYSPNAAARILEESRTVVSVMNNYAQMSFNFGPTLLAWLERQAPDVYQAIIAADRESRTCFAGHGSAIAQIYNHVIMPLATRRDKYTQIKWGIYDFERRFGRSSEGMWLAETAVDLETLEILAENGILFTILAPRQARRVRKLDGSGWLDVSDSRIDPKRPYLCRLPSGRSISIFFYDGPISQDIAFGGLLSNGEALANRWMSAFVSGEGSPQLVHFATDGETYGHHHRHGEMALAYALDYIERREDVSLTVYGEYLEKFPPFQEVEIVENTSWSCIHGIERWRSDCGCNSGRMGWSQQWRTPLREALDWLRDRLAGIFESETTPMVDDPWAMRDDYISVIPDRSPDNVESFFQRHLKGDPSRDDKVKMLRLLEMQRHSLLMFTSCGWFFDEISGLETTQVMQYAARAMQLASIVSKVNLDPVFLEILGRAESNLPSHANGAEIFEKFARPATVDLMRVGAHYAVSSLFDDYQETTTLYSYTAKREFYERRELGKQKLALGRAHLRSEVTWDERMLSFAVLHLGGHSLIGGVREYAGQEVFEQMRQEINQAFADNDLPNIIRLMDHHFQTHNYSLRHLFRDQQRKIFNHTLETTLAELEANFRQIYENHYPLMQMMSDLGMPLPKALAVPAEYTINAKLRLLLEEEMPDLDQLRQIVDEIQRWSFESEKTTLGLAASRRITSMMEKLESDPSDISLITMIEALLRILNAPSIELDLMKAQLLHFRISRGHHSLYFIKAEEGDEKAREWIKNFDRLGTLLQVRSA